MAYALQKLLVFRPVAFGNSCSFHGRFKGNAQVVHKCTDRSQRIIFGAIFTGSIDLVGKKYSRGVSTKCVEMALLFVNIPPVRKIDYPCGEVIFLLAGGTAL